MKAPKEILLARHQAAAAKLDAIRQEVVAQHRAPAAAENSTGFLSQLWSELIWPCRRVWTGLAAVWILLAIINVSQNKGSTHLAAKSHPSTETMMAYRDEQKLLNELLADHSLTMDAERPKIFLPKPRTEIINYQTA